MRLRLASALLVLGISAHSGAAAADTIGDPHFGFTTALPNGLRHCEEGLHVGNGFVVNIPLDAKDDAPCGEEKTRIIRLLAVIVDSPDPEDLSRRLRSECTGAKKPRCLKAPSGLHLGSLAGKAFRMDYPDGTRRIGVAGYGTESPPILYLAGVTTTRASYAADLIVFRRVLGGIHLSAPQP